jgi:hypothetical protein
MSCQSFKYFDFSFYFAFLHGFEGFDNDLLIEVDSDSGVDFGVLALSYFVDDFVAVDVAEFELLYPYSIS